MLASDGVNRRGQAVRTLKQKKERTASMKKQVCAGLFVAVSLAGTALYAQGGDSHTVTAEQYERWKTELSNWGRWGGRTRSAR